MEIKGWNQNELDYLKDNYSKHTNKELVDILKKTEYSIGRVAHQLGIFKQPHKSWTKEEDDFLREHYIDMTSKEIGERFGRSVQSINSRRDVLGLVRYPNWTKNEEEYLIANYKNMTHAEIGITLGKTEQAVRAKCFDMDLYKKDPPWNDSDLKFLLDNYQYMCTRELAEMLGRTVNSVTLKANRNGIVKFPYYCNYHYFDNIDTEDKAYWLGFLMADGWISKKRDDTGKVVGVELQYRDIGHLKKFNKSINGNYKITDRWRKCSLSTSNKKNHSCIIRIYSRILHDALVRYGFTYCKSFDACIPEMESQLIRHFIRGYFDGNGSVCFSRNILKVNFCTASEKFKNDLLKTLKDAGIEIKDYSYVDEFGTTIYTPTITNNGYKYALLDYMYDGATIYLERKYKRYLKVKKYAV